MMPMSGSRRVAAALSYKCVCTYQLNSLSRCGYYYEFVAASIIYIPVTTLPPCSEGYTVTPLSVMASHSAPT